MVDNLSKARRSWNMGRIRNKNTRPEIAVRSLLHRMGYRFTVNGPRNKTLPGRPDIVLPRHGTVIFVHGCFWHRHPGCRFAYTPKSQNAFWQQKFANNVRRDRIAARQLGKLGWHVVIIWECKVNDNALAGWLTKAIRTQSG